MMPDSNHMISTQVVRARYPQVIGKAKSGVSPASRVYPEGRDGILDLNSARRARSRAIEAKMASSTLRHGKPIIFVIDDDASVHGSIEQLVAFSGWQVETFASAQGFLSYPRVSVPSCAILDVNLPDLDGLEVQRRIAADRKEMPVIFVTGYGDVPITVRAMKAGAVEFFMKPFDDDELLAAIGQALERSRASLEHEAELLALRERYESLSGREREVMALVVAGLLNKQVGFELGISEITVKAHRGKVMRKMQANSLAALINMAAKLGLPPSEHGR